MFDETRKQRLRYLTADSTFANGAMARAALAGELTDRDGNIQCAGYFRSEKEAQAESDRLNKTSA